VAFDACRVTADVQVIDASGNALAGATVVPVSERNGGPSMPPNHETGPAVITGLDGHARICDIAESGNLPTNYEECRHSMSYACSHRRGSIEVTFRDWPLQSVPLDHVATMTVTLHPTAAHGP
jgi:hypothetical protein